MWVFSFWRYRFKQNDLALSHFFTINSGFSISHLAHRKLNTANLQITYFHFGNIVLHTFH